MAEIRKQKLLLVGGDKRQIAMKTILEKAGWQVFSLGLGEGEENPKALISDADCILLPLPYTRDGLNVFAPFASRPIPVGEIIKTMSPGQLLLCGMADESLTKCCEGKGIRLYDLYSSENVQIRNAIPTAEGAIAIAMELLPVTIFGTKAAIIGCGRIGKQLLLRLHSLGADVTLCARREGERAFAETVGAKACKCEELSREITDARAVFNTVPAQIIGKEILSSSREDCIFIDLASPPGGIDRKAAVETGRKVISALSLPGKVAPETAAETLAREVMRILGEEYG